MGWLDRLRKKDRRFWFVCYTCLQMTDHDTLNSVFYEESPPAMILGRLLTSCPRCSSTNTKSFQQLKEEGVGSEAALWGLERLIKKHPRTQFEVKKSEAGQK